LLAVAEEPEELVEVVEEGEPPGVWVEFGMY